jgi:hypothetical protein
MLTLPLAQHVEVVRPQAHVHVLCEIIDEDAGSRRRATNYMPKEGVVARNEAL